MKWLPWGNSEQDDSDAGVDSDAEPDDDTPDGDEDAAYHQEADPIVTCEFQDGTLYVFDDQLFIERTERSKFSEKWIALEQVTDVRYASRLVVGYIQIAQQGFENSEGGRLSAPVDENTLHFGHGKRACAKRARDAILERIAGD